MSLSADNDVRALVADWAATAVRTQELLDRAWLAEARRWHAAADSLSPAAAAAALALAPARPVIREHRLEAGVRVRLERTVGLRVGMQPLSVASRLLARAAAAPAVPLPGWSRRRTTAQTGGSRMRVTVVPVPPPKP